MSIVTRPSGVAPLLIATVLALGPAATVVARDVGTLEPTTASGSVDLTAALDASGTFRGLDGLSGSVDLSRWTLVSDPSAGGAPRFVQARRNRARPAGPGDWSAVGGSPGNPALSQEVHALTSKRTLLYLGGNFLSIPGVGDADNIASWDDSAFAAIGSTNDILGATVNAIAIDGSDLYVGGTFTDADGLPSADRVAKWEGSTSTWESLGGSLNAPVNAIAVHGSNIYVGGDFTGAGGIAAADYIARYDGSWHAMGSRAGDGVLADQVNAIAIDGANVYVGGLFTNANGDTTADYLARWDGSSWSPLGSNVAGTNGALSDQVYALLFSGRDLWVGGNFQNVAGIGEADFVARWRGGAWSALGTTAALSARVHALAKVGEDLFVGGHFEDADGIPEADRVAGWDGTDWFALGSDGSGDGAIPDTVLALAEYKGDLYVGGVFEEAAGIDQADYLARWQLEEAYRPDGRVRVGTSGPFKGDGIYNAGGKHQKVTKSVGAGTWITFQVSLQSDSATSTDTFTVDADGAVNGDFIVKYLQGNQVVTGDVESGDHESDPVAAGNDRKLKVRIKVKASAAIGEELTRTIRITSVSDPTKVDVVKVVARRQ